MFISVPEGPWQVRALVHCTRLATGLHIRFSKYKSNIPFKNTSNFKVEKHICLVISYLIPMTFILAQSEDLNAFLSKTTYTSTLSYLIAFANIIGWFLLLFLLHFTICEKSRTDITSSSCVVAALLSFNAVI